MKNSIGVVPIVDKMREIRLRCSEHILRREKTEAVRVTKKIKLKDKIGKRKRKEKQIVLCDTEGYETLRVVGVR